jgi:hypothetical protein
MREARLPTTKAQALACALHIRWLGGGFFTRGVRGLKPTAIDIRRLQSLSGWSGISDRVDPVDPVDLIDVKPRQGAADVSPG